MGDGAFGGRHQARVPSPHAAFDLPSRQKPPQQHMPGIFATQSPCGPFSNLRDPSPGSVEMDLSPGPSTTSSNDNNKHQHPSPATTNASHHSSGGGSSSHTSFTPPSYDDNSNNNNQHPTPPQHQPPTGYTFPQQTNNFNTSADSSAVFTSGPPEGQYMPVPPQTADNHHLNRETADTAFTGGPWDFDAHAGTGMTPDPEGIFSQMMEVAWDDGSAYVAAAAAGNNAS